MDILDFGSQLITTGDLDPVYHAIHKAPKARGWKFRTCVAYWMLYDLGVSATMADPTPSKGQSFWDHLQRHVETPASRRGTERRHFRGQKAIDAVVALRKQFPRPSTMVSYLHPSGPGGEEHVGDVIERAQALPQFGPWIAFKVADMLDRCLGLPVHFDQNTAIHLYRNPARGLKLVADEWEQSTEETAHQLIKYWAHIPAPPAKDRPVGWAEVETILCKYKSYRDGHYHVGKDIKEIREACAREGQSVLATFLPELV